MQIKNKDLALFLDLKLNKIGNEFSSDELEKLKELVLNQYNIFNEFSEVDIEVLDFTKNLESLDLKNFEITDEIIDKIKKIETLKKLSLDHCLIEDFNKIGDIDVDYLGISNNKFLNTDFLKNKSYKGLMLSDSLSLDIENIKDMDNLKILNLSNSNIVNPSLISDLKSLNILHIENTDIKDISFLKELPELNEVGIDKKLYDYSYDIVSQLEDKDVLFLEKGIVPIKLENRKYR